MHTSYYKANEKPEDSFLLFHFINEVLETSMLETLDISLSLYKELHILLLMFDDYFNQLQ